MTKTTVKIITITNWGKKYRRCGRLFFYGPDRKWNYITRRNTPKKAERMRKLDQKYHWILDGCMFSFSNLHPY